MNRLIFGCGYLGLRVAKRWVEAGDKVFAITRNPDRVETLERIGLTAIVADITDRQSLNELPQVDTVLVAVGMDRSKYSDIREVYVEGLRNVLDAISNSLSRETGQLIYVSSTGVYGDFDGEWVDEDSATAPKRDGGKACLEAEQLIQESSYQPRSTILRFAGIYGTGRVPTRDLIESKQWKKLSSAGYLNLIHVEDGADVVTTVANAQPSGGTFLVSDGNPTLRQNYYEFIANQFGIASIPWEESIVDTKNSRSGTNKRIGNKKLVKHYSIKFQYPDYRAGLKQALEC
ncbi:MAG: SDR family oxidoreductase [Mariniblastus sp.]